MIAHIDGDAFFASVYQATHPNTKGKPVAIGRERGIATAVSYEAKARGITRGMQIYQIKKICPDCIIATSAYHTYENFSRKMIAIAYRYSPAVERYSIDEMFLTIDNPSTAQKIKNEIEASLGLTVSAGIAPTKCLAKIGSNFQKPSGFITITPLNRDYYLKNTPIKDIWGIGRRLAIRMQSLNIHTAFDLIQQKETLLSHYFNKCVLEIWHELKGNCIYRINTDAKTTYKSIQKTATQTPATNNIHIIRARLFDHIEHAFIKARRYHYRVGALQIFLKTQQFTFHAAHIKFPEKVAYPFLIRPIIDRAFKQIFTSSALYRATGCTLFDLESTDYIQENLFSPYVLWEDKLKKIYPLIDQKRVTFGSQLFNPQITTGTFFSLPKIHLQ